MEKMDLEKSPMTIQRNPNNDLKYFSEVGYHKEQKEEQSESKKEQNQDLQYFTE